MRYQYYTCDVFTQTRFGGKPLAVLPKADALSDHQMQQIAREFNYSETAFVFPPNAGHTRKVRLFTPVREVPFAGHPNVGDSFMLVSGIFLTGPGVAGGNAANPSKRALEPTVAPRLRSTPLTSSTIAR